MISHEGTVQWTPLTVGHSCFTGTIMCANPYLNRHKFSLHKTQLKSEGFLVFVGDPQKVTEYTPPHRGGAGLHGAQSLILWEVDPNITRYAAALKAVVPANFNLKAATI
ncbi:hypothetical protein TNCV_4925031 [Trichonephila clavipes]|nr:hypothetical protein TNCV_4925031 [Trichonephila clavipes]